MLLGLKKLSIKFLFIGIILLISCVSIGDCVIF